MLEEITVSELGNLISDIVKTEIKNLPKEPSYSKKEVYGSRKEVAKSLRISLPTLNQLTKTGILKGYRLQGRVLYKWVEVDEALRRIEAIENPKAQ